MVSVYHTSSTSTYRVCSLSPRIPYLLFSTREPAAVQRMPWPQTDENAGPDWLGHETWLLNKENFAWLQGTEGKRTRFLSEYIFI